MKKVLITVPNTGSINAQVAAVLLDLQRDRHYALRFEFPRHVPYENNLHHIIRDSILREEGPDFWLNIDSDNPPVHNPLDLVALDLDVVGLPTPIWYYKDNGHPKGERPYYWNVYQYNAAGKNWKEWEEKGNGLREVDAVGSGCFLASRRVFEHPDMAAPFIRKTDDDGIVIRGTDLAFCRRATSAGFKIYAHFDYPCRHHKTLDLLEVVRGFGQLYQPGLWSA